MKLMKVVLIAILSIVVTSVYAQDVTYTLTNPRVETDGVDSFFLTDVLTYSNEGFKLGSGQLYFTYDTTAVGANVFSNSSLEVILPDSSMLNHRVGTPPFQFSFYSSLITNDNTYNRFSQSWQHSFSGDCMIDQNVNPFSDALFTIKLRFKQGYSHVDPALCLEGSAVYIDQTFTACGPDPCNTADCLNHPGSQVAEDVYTCSDCLIVYSTADAGPGTLRGAIECAASGDTVRFSPNLRADSIILTSSTLEVDKALVIAAKAKLGIAVNGVGVDRTLDILNNGDLVLSGLSIVGGSAVDGAAIRNVGNLLMEFINVEANGNVSTNSTVHNLGSLLIKEDVSID